MEQPLTKTAVKSTLDQDCKQGCEPGRQQLIKPALGKMLILQGLALLVTTGVLLWVDQLAAISALLGGLIAIIPNAYFAKWAFRYSGARAADKVAQSFYRGEAGKFILTSILFALVFIGVKPLNVLVIFVTYISMMALSWLLALRFIKR